MMILVKAMLNKFLNELIIGGFVKTARLRHSRVGGNLEGSEMTRSKSVLISRLRGNDSIPTHLSIYTIRT
jgi:hypothetical protein